MTEEIIIERGCNYCNENDKDTCYLVQLKQAENTVNECHKYLAELEDKIESLEQERDELKKTVENQKLEYEELQCDLSEVENACGCYQSENAKLKQENKELKDLNKKICEDWEKEIKVYWNALEEIRKAIKSYGLTVDNGASVDTIYTIGKIINEVLNEKEL